MMAPVPKFATRSRSGSACRSSATTASRTTGSPPDTQSRIPSRSSVPRGARAATSRSAIVDDERHAAADRPGRARSVIADQRSLARGERATTTCRRRPCAAWRNLWFHTGDRGYLDADGYLYFVDRKKDAIRRRGENISAFEVEHDRPAHPAVAEVAAFPVRVGDERGRGGSAPRSPKTRRRADRGQTLIALLPANMAYFMVAALRAGPRRLPRALNHKVEKYRIARGSRADPGDRAGIATSAGIVVRR